MSGAVEHKVDRISRGGGARLLDLFAGCGGLSLGFKRAGCRPLGGVELDPSAARSYAVNFHGEPGTSEYEIHARPRDITEVEPLELMRELGHRSPAEVVDLIVGGPPCPAYTRVGRAKLREISKHPEAFKHDPRARLYIPFLMATERLLPVAVVMENVPDILNFASHNLGEEIAEALEALGYDCNYTLLNAINYGVPQIRERFFLIAIHREVGTRVTFPKPTCLADLPKGYEGSRDVAMRYIRQTSLFSPSARYVTPPSPDRECVPPVTVAEAIGDLPPITEHLHGNLPKGARRFNRALDYREEWAVSPYALEMRTWPGYETSGKLVDHVTRSLGPRDIRLFAKMAPGDDYPQAHALAVSLLDQALKHGEKRGEIIPEGSKGYKELYREYVPPYDKRKFPNKWRKMEPDQPARTLMAHLGKDSYTHIHYDSAQARVLTVREAARLHSFPDGFRFCGTMNPAFRQIGNAVPPLLAYAIARAVVASIGGRSSATQVRMANGV